MKKNKEHKKGESTIGKIIYGFLLFMPLFAIGVTCGYAMFNKNAYLSYSPENSINFVNANNTNTLEGNTLYFRYDSSVGGYNYSQQYYYDWISINYEDYIANWTTIAQYNPDGIQVYDVGILRLHNPNNNEWTSYNTNINLQTGIWGVTLDNFTLTLSSNVTNPFEGGKAKIQVAYPLQQKLDEVFYNAVDKVTESPLFSWATNSVIYTTMNATCSQLSITAPFIPLLLSYWLIISVIYFLYDIALMLICLLHDKIHEMRDSLA